MLLVYRACVFCLYRVNVKTRTIIILQVFVFPENVKRGGFPW